MTSPEHGIREYNEREIESRLATDIRPFYEPAFEYHNWHGHIEVGMNRIDELQAFYEDLNIKVNWHVVRLAYLGHDAWLTLSLTDPSILEGYDCAERLACAITTDLLASYGTDQEIIDQVSECILATNPKMPCDSPEAKATCKVDIGNTGDSIEEFVLNFIRIQKERNTLEDTLKNPVSAVGSACEFIELYLRRSELSLGAGDNFPSLVEKNISQVRSMGSTALRGIIMKVAGHLIKSE